MVYRTTEKQLKWLVLLSNGLGAVCVLAILSAAYYGYGFTHREIGSLERQRQADLTLMAKAAEVRPQRDTAANHLNTLHDQVEQMKSRLPVNPNEAEFLAQLSTLAEESAVKLKNFRPGQIAGTGSIQTFDVQLSLVGPFANICRMLHGLSELPRYLSVSHLTLSGPQVAGDACIADVTISLCFAPVVAKADEQQTTTKH